MSYVVGHVVRENGHAVRAKRPHAFAANARVLLAPMKQDLPHLSELVGASWRGSSDAFEDAFPKTRLFEL